MKSDFNILLIEDNPGDAMLMEELLSDSNSFNFKIIHAETLKDGLDLLLTKEVNIVLLDLGLPDSQGLNALEAMLDNAGQIPIVVITGLDDEETGRKAINMGAQNYMVKGLLNQRAIIDSISYAVERNKILLELRDKDMKLEESNKLLQESNKAKERLIAMLSHDLRGPVKTVVALFELLAENYHDLTDEKKLHVIKTCVKSGNSTIEFMENLLAWARSQADGKKIKPKNIPVKEFIDDTLDPLMHQIMSKKISIKNKTSDEDSFFADVDMIATVVRNLVANSIKFTPPDGEIVINAKKISKDSIEISVKDSGVGIKKDDLDKLFDVSAGFTTTGTHGEKGTGFGMVLSKEFVEKNNGTLQIYSEEGKGTTVSFSLPLAR